MSSRLAAAWPFFLWSAWWRARFLPWLRWQRACQQNPAQGLLQWAHGVHNPLTQALVQAHPKLKGIFGTNEPGAIGAGKGIKEAKKTGVTIIGFDSGKAQKDMINDGTIAGSITQNPVGIGYKTVEAAVKTLKGEKLPKIIDTGFYYYDKSNMADPKIAAVLYD